MDAKQKMAIAGAGLVATGLGLSVMGAVLIIPIVAALAVKGLEKGSAQLISGVELATKTAGTIAGTLQRSFSEARR